MSFVTVETDPNLLQTLLFLTGLIKRTSKYKHCLFYEAEFEVQGGHIQCNCSFIVSIKGSNMEYLIAVNQVQFDECGVDKCKKH